MAAHLLGNTAGAEQLIRAADMDELREWTKSLWGKGSPYVKPPVVAGAPPVLAQDQRIVKRMPDSGAMMKIHESGGYLCFVLGALQPSCCLWHGPRTLRRIH